MAIALYIIIYDNQSSAQNDKQTDTHR